MHLLVSTFCVAQETSLRVQTSHLVSEVGSLRCSCQRRYMTLWDRYWNTEIRTCQSQDRCWRVECNHGYSVGPAGTSVLPSDCKLQYLDERLVCTARAFGTYKLFNKLQREVKGDQDHRYMYNTEPIGTQCNKKSHHPRTKRRWENCSKLGFWNTKGHPKLVWSTWQFWAIRWQIPLDSD